MKIHNIIFDLDGCLIDSTEVQKAAFFGAYKEVVGDNKCPSYEEYIKHTGDSVDNVLRQLSLPAEMAAVFRRISAESVDRININWAAMNLIKLLRESGWRCAICTGKDRDRTEAILRYYGVGELFDVLVCADDVIHPKPSPEPVLQTISKLGCTNDEVVFVGDGYNDILSANAAGVLSILSLWYGDNGVPKEANYCANSIDELGFILDSEL